MVSTTAKSAATTTPTLIVNQETVGEERVGRVRLQIVDEHFLVDDRDALDRLGAESRSVEGVDAIADLQCFEGLERPVADVEGMLRRDMDLDVSRLYDLVLIHLVSQHGADPGAYTWPAIVTPARGRQVGRAIWELPIRRPSGSAFLARSTLVVNHDTVGQIGPARRHQQVVGRFLGGHASDRRDNTLNHGILARDEDAIARTQ